MGFGNGWELCFILVHNGAVMRLDVHLCLGHEARRWGCHTLCPVPFVVIEAFVPYIHVDPGSVFPAQARRHSLGQTGEIQQTQSEISWKILFTNTRTVPGLGTMSVGTSFNLTYRLMAPSQQ